MKMKKNKIKKVVQRHSAVYNSVPLQRSTKTIEKNGDVVYYYNDPPATVHLVIGTGGAFFTKNAVDPPPSWNENYFYEYGYARVKAFNASRLEYEWINSDSMEVMDRFVITKSKSTPDSTSDNSLGTQTIAIITAFTVAGFLALVVFNSIHFFSNYILNCKYLSYITFYLNYALGFSVLSILQKTPPNALKLFID